MRMSALFGAKNLCFKIYGVSARTREEGIKPVWTMGEGVDFVRTLLWSAIKTVCTKSRKIDPLLPCPCGHTINFDKSCYFYAKKCGRPHLKIPPLVRTGQIPFLP